MGHTLKKFLRIHGIPALFSLTLAMLAALALHLGLTLQFRYDHFLNAQGLTFRNVFLLEGVQGIVTTAIVLAGLGTVIFLAGAILSLIRKPRALAVIRGCLLVFYGLSLFYSYGVLRLTALIFEKNLPFGHHPITPITVFFWRYHFLWPWGLLALAIASLHVFSWRRVVLDLYLGYHEDTPALGDRIVENIRTHGKNPVFRKSIIASVLIHFFIIVILPLLAQLRGCGSVEAYLIPQGSGNPVIGIVRVVKPKKQVKKRVVLNPHSAISFHPPDLEDSRVAQDVEEATAQTYVADATSAHEGTGKAGGLGAGGGGPGGWPDGMKNAVIRFVRLEYDGEDWDDGMDNVAGADRNFLVEFKKVTGFRVATHSESHPIHLLDNYPKGFAPPFVYMTGSDRINISRRDIEILRKYLIDGGMLFADCASERWDRSFRAFMQVLFPGEPLLVIADDDPIFQMPFVFENGAPPLWHHGGSRTLGIRRGRRWMVFYHPGDINDAWKTGHSGMRPELVKRAYQVGINIVYHAFTHYLEATRKYRK